MIAAGLGVVAAFLVAWIRYAMLNNRSRLQKRSVSTQSNVSVVEWLWQQPEKSHITRRVAHALLNTLEALGQRVEQLLQLHSHQRTSRHRHLTACVVVCSALLCIVHFAVGLAAFGIYAGNTMYEKRRLQTRKHRQLLRDLPFVIDVMHIAVQSGCTVQLALEYACRGLAIGKENIRHRGDDLAVSLDFTRREVACGKRFSDAMTDLGIRHGREVAMFTSALVSCERNGSPISASLQRMSREMRIDQSRRLEVAARRLSVSLLFPLAGCVFPAFVLLTVVPLLAGSLETLAISIK